MVRLCLAISCSTITETILLPHNRWWWRPWRPDRVQGALFLRHFTILGKFKFSQSSKNQVFQTLILSCEIDNESAFYSYGSLLKLRLHFLAFDHVRTPIVCTFYVCSKSSIFLTTYSPLNANVICEGSLPTRDVIFIFSHIIN